VVVFDKKENAIIYYRKYKDKYTGLVIGRESRNFYTVLVRKGVESERYEVIYKKYQAEN